MKENVKKKKEKQTEVKVKVPEKIELGAIHATLFDKMMFHDSVGTVESETLGLIAISRSVGGTSILISFRDVPGSRGSLRYIINIPINDILNLIEGRLLDAGMKRKSKGNKK